MALAKTTSRRDEKHLSWIIWCSLYQRFEGDIEFQVDLKHSDGCPSNYPEGYNQREAILVC